MENFTEIPSYPGHFINKAGIVKKAAFVSPSGRNQKERILQNFRNNNADDRPYVQISYNGKSQRKPIAHLLVETFIAENWKQDFTIKYRDMNPANAVLENIYIYPKPIDLLEKRIENDLLKNFGQEVLS